MPPDRPRPGQGRASAAAAHVSPGDNADLDRVFDAMAHPLHLPNVSLLHSRPTTDQLLGQTITPPEIIMAENDQAAEARRIVRTAVLSFNEFPAGVEYGDKIWVKTDKTFNNQHGQQGEVIAGVTSKGDMEIYEAFRMPNEEWDLEGASSRPANDDEVLKYARRLMTEVELRIDEARTKEFARVVIQQLPRNTERANHLTAGYRTVRQAVQELSILEAQRESTRSSSH